MPDYFRDPTLVRKYQLSRMLPGVEVCLILMVIIMRAGLLVPSAGEPQYLSKAKHYWDPTWCAHDFFCNTADAHAVFDWTLGWLTLCLPLQAVAWCGRVLAWVLLAWSWRRLSFALIPIPLISVLSAAVFISLNGSCQLAGEWVVQGIEAKSIAYVFIVLTAEALVLSNWKRVWVLLGVASAFHVLVGGWSTVAAAIAWLSRGKPKGELKTMLPALVCGSFFALAGLVPALSLTWNVDQSVKTQANEIYVYERLPHHLVPQHFTVKSRLRYGTLLTVWFGLTLVGWHDKKSRDLSRFIAGALLINIIGVGLGILVEYDRALAAELLKFYWFRISDVLLPLGVALLACSTIARLYHSRPLSTFVLSSVITIVVALYLGPLAWQKSFVGHGSGEGRLERINDWRATCRWVANNTPKDAVFFTPRRSQTFRWHADRSEVVNWKDIPQDAVGIVEWRQRIADVYRLDSENVTECVDSTLLMELAQKYGATHLIAAAQTRLDLEMISPAGSYYAVYRLDRHISRQLEASDK